MRGSSAPPAAAAGGASASAASKPAWDELPVPAAYAARLGRAPLAPAPLPALTYSAPRTRADRQLRLDTYRGALHALRDKQYRALISSAQHQRASVFDGAVAHYLTLTSLVTGAAAIVDGLRRRSARKSWAGPWVAAFAPALWLTRHYRVTEEQRQQAAAAWQHQAMARDTLARAIDGAVSTQRLDAAAVVASVQALDAAYCAAANTLVLTRPGDWHTAAWHHVHEREVPALHARAAAEDATLSAAYSALNLTPPPPPTASVQFAPNSTWGPYRRANVPYPPHRLERIKECLRGNECHGPAAPMTATAVVPLPATDFGQKCAAVAANFFASY